MPFGKRAVDIVFSSVGLLLLSPLFFVVAVLIKLDSPGPAIFKQKRIGRNLRPFKILKFRTMTAEADEVIRLSGNRDPRVTRVGRFLRKTKIDELPQLINVFKGDMSLVGPRPEVPRYVEILRRDFEEILRVRPGMTDLASIKYRDEASVLGSCENPEREYVEKVLPEKITLAKEYLKHSSMAFDLTIILKTLLKVTRG